jgi:hypothetical protein
MDAVLYYRRFANGIEIRVVPGHKTSRYDPTYRDRRVEIRTPGGEWVAPALLEWAVVAQLFALNEDGLYPPSKGLSGGQMVFDMMADVPCMGGDAAYDKWVEAPRRRRELARAA